MKSRWLATIAAIALAFGLLMSTAACDDKGKPCDKAGSIQSKSGSSGFLTCKYDPISGGNTWQ